VKTLIEPLKTKNLRIEPITIEIARHAEAGSLHLAEHLDARVPKTWWAQNLRMLAARPRQPEHAIIIHREENIVVGDLRFDPVTGALRTYEIGYSIIPDYRRRGIASEGAGAVLDWLFGEGEAERCIAGCDRRNTGSVKTLRKLGFWLDSSRGNAFWWTITPEQRAEKVRARL
jgi:[ribosomal protein S5]-alanine N-acetyltransferase